MKQTSFSFIKNNYRKEFGGSLLKNKRKSQRPLSIKLPIHLVLRSHSAKIFLPSQRSLEFRMKKLAEKYYIRIYSLSLNWNHVHLVLKVNSREDYKRFIRHLTSSLALLAKKKGKVFEFRPYTRILTWGREFETILNYIRLNDLEAFGFLNRKKLKADILRLRQIKRRVQ